MNEHPFKAGDRVAVREGDNALNQGTSGIVLCFCGRDNTTAVILVDGVAFAIGVSRLKPEGRASK